MIPAPAPTNRSPGESESSPQSARVGFHDPTENRRGPTLRTTYVNRSTALRDTPLCTKCNKRHWNMHNCDAFAASQVIPILRPRPGEHPVEARRSLISDGVYASVRNQPHPLRRTHA